MYYPRYVKVPKDVYFKALQIAGSYYELKKRRKKFKGMERQNKINEWQIRAIEDAMHSAAKDESERIFIAKNLFEGVQMSYIPLPMSQSTMKRVRREFLDRLVENLGLM